MHGEDPRDPRDQIRRVEGEAGRNVSGGAWRQGVTPPCNLLRASRGSMLAARALQARGPLGGLAPALAVERGRLAQVTGARVPLEGNERGVMLAWTFGPRDVAWSGWLGSGTASSAAPHLCRAVSMPGSARLAAGRTWNRGHAGHRTAEATALGWSIAAMCDVTGRLGRVRAGDQARMLAAVGEAVWWVTIVDATLVRHYPGAYDGILSSQPTAKRRQIEGMLAGLRFVRNGMGLRAITMTLSSPAPRRPGGDETSPPGPGSPVPSRTPLASAARAGVGESAVPGIPGAACRSLVTDTFERASEFLRRAAASADLPHEYEHAAAR